MVVSRTEKLKLAMRAIQDNLNSDKQDAVVKQFIQYHLSTIESEYWDRVLHTSQPTVGQICELLEPHKPCIMGGQEDEHCIRYLDNHFDFTLPQEITDYVLCVAFRHGQVMDISIEH